MFYDPNGHVVVIYELLPNGELRFFDGHPDGYVTHERAFLLPDLTLAALLAATAVLTLLGSQAKDATGLLAAGMMLFLGLIDLGYDLGNGAKAWEYTADAAIMASTSVPSSSTTAAAARVASGWPLTTAHRRPY